MTLIQAKLEAAKRFLLEACDYADRETGGDAAPPGFREAIEALPDLTKIDALEPMYRLKIEEVLARFLSTPMENDENQN